MKAFRLPIFILLLTLLLCLFGGSSIRRCAQAWQQQVQLVQSAVRQADWPRAQKALNDLNAQWQTRQEGLHMLVEHEDLDEIESLLHRCIAFAAIEDDAELPADLAELSARLTLLSENQRLSLRNVL